MIDHKHVIELKNVGVYNKGAYLMLLAIKEQFSLREYEKDVLFCGEHGPGRTYFSLGSNKMMQLPKVGRRNYFFLKAVLPTFPQKIRHQLGILLPSEVDHVIDGSGFGFGDFWGASKPDSQMLSTCRSVKKKGGKVILLPQALGPFNSPDVKANFGKLVNLADLICARDKVSYQHLVDSYGEDDRFVMFPDFTNLLTTPACVEFDEGNVCIIPNEKMTKIEGADASVYYEWLTEMCRKVIAKGLSPYWLIHEGKGDLKIANLVNESLDMALPIIDSDDPIHLKHRIKCARFVIVSRFHGLVSALSQGVPAIATSWSHKYRMLSEEYNVEHYLVDVNSPNSLNKSEELLSSLTNESEYVKVVEVIRKNARIEKARSEEMWNKVFSVFGEVLAS